MPLREHNFFQMSQRWRAISNTVSDLTRPRFEPQTTCFKDERLPPNLHYSATKLLPDIKNRKCYQTENLNIATRTEIIFVDINRPVGRAVTHSSLKQEVRGSNLGLVKSDTVLPTARHRCNISSKEAAQ